MIFKNKKLVLTLFSILSAANPQFILAQEEITQTINTHRSTNQTTRPSEDGYSPKKVNNKNRYLMDGFSFDRVNRSYIYQPPHSKQSGLNANKYPLNPDYIIKNNTKTTNGKYPLIILYHPGGQTAKDVWEQTSLPEFTYSNDFYLLAPNAHNRHWNDGKKEALEGEKKSHIDDVGFTMALVEMFVTNHNIDPKRIYVVGISNGGYFTTHLACRTYGLISGGVNILSNITFSDTRSCSNESLPWLSIVGGEDSITPFLGNINGESLSADIIKSSEETFNFFSSNNKCLNISGYNQLPNFESNNKTRVFMKLASRCNNDTQNVLLSIKGGGHQIPNVPPKFKNTKPFHGEINNDIDTGTTIFNFLLNQNNKF